VCTKGDRRIESGSAERIGNKVGQTGVTANHEGAGGMSAYIFTVF
jgi:hypothetical protein